MEKRGKDYAFLVVLFFGLMFVLGVLAQQQGKGAFPELVLGVLLLLITLVIAVVVAALFRLAGAPNALPKTKER